MKRGPILAGAVFFYFLSAAGWAALEKAGYDPFTSKMAYAPAHSAVKTAASEFLTYPFEIFIRWPLNKFLVFLEENRVSAKTLHVLDKLQEKGISPKLSFTSVGAEFDLPSLFRLQDRLPKTLVAKSWIHYAPKRVFEAGAKLGVRTEGATGFQAFGNTKYEVRPEEDFYGIGPDANKGDKASYKMETTALEAVAGYVHETDFGIDSRIGWRNINISRSHDKVFLRDYDFLDRNPTTGVYGDTLLNLGLEAAWAPKENENRITVPGKALISADYIEGVRGSDARYFKFLTEFMKNFTLGSERRIFAARFYGEQNSAVGGGKVPFHQMARLGGFGPHYRQSQTLRSYADSRFTAEGAVLFNFEYRYRVYEYRQWTLAHVIFFDEGQVFQNYGRFQWKDFRESYGTGLRLNFLHFTILNLEMAHGDEGAAFHIRNRQPF